MLGSGQLAHLQRRKAVLLRRSERHRRALMVVAPELRAAAGWVDLGVESAGMARTALAVLLPGVAWWRWSSSGDTGVVARIARACSLVAKLSAVWRRGR